MKRQALLLLIFALVAVVILSSCMGDSTPQKDTLYVGTQMHNGLYNPLYAATVYDEDVCNLIFEGLVVDVPDGINHINDRLVKEFKMSDDGLEYTFVLKDGIKFSDGKPLTAKDVVFTYKVLADPSSTARNNQYITALQGGSSYMEGTTTDFVGVKEKDKSTVVFYFTNAQRANLKNCSIKIISEDYYKGLEYGNADIYMHEKMKAPIGSGPYKLKKLTDGEGVVLEKNKSYWAEDETNYNIKYVDIKFLKNDEIIPAVQSGEVEFIPQITNADTYKALEKWQDSIEGYSDLEFSVFQRNAYGFLGFNTRSGSSSDSAIRRAIAYSFNREAFVEEYFGDLGESVDAQLPSSSELYPKIVNDINHYTYSLENAQKVLEEAGYITENEVLTKDGKPVSIKFLVTEDNFTVSEIETRLKESLSALGIELVSVPMAFGEIIDTIKSEDDDWNMFFMVDDWRGDDPSELTAYFSSSAIPRTNVTRYQNPMVDDFLERGDIGSLDDYTDEVLDNYIKVLLQLNSDLPEIPIYTNKVVAVKNVRIKDLNFGTYQRWSEGLDGAYLENK